VGAGGFGVGFDVAAVGFGVLAVGSGVGALAVGERDGAAPRVG
jgi:hypothetical protein